MGAAFKCSGLCTCSVSGTLYPWRSADNGIPSPWFNFTFYPEPMPYELNVHYYADGEVVKACRFAFGVKRL